MKILRILKALILILIGGVLACWYIEGCLLEVYKG